MILRITHTDIAEGVCRDSWQCAVSKALERMHPEYKFHTSWDDITAYHKKGFKKSQKAYARIEVSPELCDFIRAFDESEILPLKFRPLAFAMKDLKDWDITTRGNDGEREATGVGPTTPPGDPSQEGRQD